MKPSAGSGWGHRFGVQLRDMVRSIRRRANEATPFEQIRFAFSLLLLACGAGVFAVLVVPAYDRALTLSGRTEVLSMRLDDPAFGTLSFPGGIYRADPDTKLAPPARVLLDITPGTTLRFERLGRGPLRITFEADGAASQGGCIPGLHQAGSVTAGGEPGVLCDAAMVGVPLRPGDAPLVIALSGRIVVGEEVSQGAGARPILLEATAALLVKHDNRVLRLACAWPLLENLCDRFVANSVVLAPGDSVRAEEQASHAPAGLGFVRVDPDEQGSGMLFNLAAPAVAFHVQRMQGEPFTVRESLFDVIEKSPVVRTLNTILVALGLIWYFSRLLTNGISGGGAAMLACAILCAPPALAQQALLRAEETGQALLRSRGDRCYAVTPAHVLGAENAALLTAPGREQGEGDVLRRIPAAPEMIALVAVRGIPLSLCPAFEGAQPLDDLLRAHTAATLRLVRTDGALDFVPLLLGAVEVETLEVRSVAGDLAQGMSGGTVLVADQPVGLLVDVTDGGHTGRVARLDRVFERLTPHLSYAPPAEVPHAAAGSVPYEIVRASAAPLEPANKVSSLQGDGPGPWRVAAAGRVELVLKVSAPFSGVVLDATGIPDPPAIVEVLAGRSERGPWQSLTSFSLEPGDQAREKSILSVALSYVLLRAGARPGQPTLALRGVSIVPK